jgi:hypothetical protein
LWEWQRGMKEFHTTRFGQDHSVNTHRLRRPRLSRSS